MADLRWIAKSARRPTLPTPASLHEATDQHPLKPVAVLLIDGRSATASTDTFAAGRASFDGSDPLSQFAEQRSDPSSAAATDQVRTSRAHASSQPLEPQRDRSCRANLRRLPSDGPTSTDAAEESLEPWLARRAAILDGYTASEKLSMVAGFLPGDEKVVVKVRPTGGVVDKVRTRLQRLDDFEEGSVGQTSDLSQQRYAARVDRLNDQLVQAWHSDQRVKALKIAIQCAKLLADTSVVAFYPGKFVLVTDILDVFGRLVYDRLKVKAECSCKPGSKVPAAGLPDDFTPDMVPESAKETCRNWFYKIASVRELVPRLYVEMAIIESYGFLTTSEFNAALLRITRMIRGIGDPLVAVYARCYLCRVGLALNETSDFEFVRENFYDFLFTYQQLFGPFVADRLIEQNVAVSSYLNLYSPALDWILRVLVATTRENLLEEVLFRCEDRTNGSLLLNGILTAFKPSYVARRAMDFANLINAIRDDGFPRYLLYRNLGESLVSQPPPKQDCRSILDAVWTYLAELTNPANFMHCAEIWVQFTAVHFSVDELNLFFGKIIDRLDSDKSSERYYPQLRNIVDKVVSHAQDFESLLAMDNFLPLIDLFRKESVKVEVCKTVVEAVGVRTGPVTDPIVVNALMFVARIMHDSVSALTVEDEKRQIGQLVCGLVQRVDHGRDFEKQLNFYVEARAAFPNLDSVHVQLVQCVNRLSVDARNIVRGHHTRRTSAFVRACAAFSFITIPSLTLVYTRLQLYLLSGQVALLNQCLGQADACFKAALSLLPEMPKTMDVDGRRKSSQPYLLSYLSNFLSTLLVVPDSPEHGVLYLTRGLLNAVQRCFEENTSTKTHLYLRVLDLLSTIVQESYPYHVEKVDSNDKLYGSDRKFVSEVDKISSRIVEEILSHLRYLGSTDQSEKQAALALELFDCFVVRADLRDPRLARVAVNLWNLSVRRGFVDSRVKMKTMAYMVQKSHREEYRHFADVLKKMSK